MASSSMLHSAGQNAVIGLDTALFEMKPRKSDVKVRLPSVCEDCQSCVNLPAEYNALHDLNKSMVVPMVSWTGVKIQLVPTSSIP